MPCEAESGWGDWEKRLECPESALSYQRNEFTFWTRLDAHADSVHSNRPDRSGAGTGSGAEGGLRYQTYLKTVLHEALEREERMP